MKDAITYANEAGFFSFNVVGWKAEFERLIEAVRADALAELVTVKESLIAQDHSAGTGNKVSDHIADAGTLMLTTEQAQQIEEALEDIVRVFQFETGTPIEALATIRAARAEQATVSGGLCGGCAKKAADGWALYCVECWEQAEQEPVASRWPTHNGYAYAETHFDDEGGEPLYAAPVSIQNESETDSSSSSMRTTVHTKDLTDDEERQVIAATVEGVTTSELVMFKAVARAVIAKYKEKNK